MNLEEHNQLYNFAGRNIVITGGAGILGGEMACALVGMGANIAIMDRDPALANRLITRLEGGPGRAIIVYGDVLKRDALVKAEEAIGNELGPVDTLINAGAPINYGAFRVHDGMFIVTEPDKFRDVLQTGIGHGKVMWLRLLSVVPIA